MRSRVDDVVIEPLRHPPHVHTRVRHTVTDGVDAAHRAKQQGKQDPLDEQDDALHGADGDERCCHGEDGTPQHGLGQRSPQPSSELWRLEDRASTLVTCRAVRSTMSTVTTLPAHDDGWTIDDLYAIPEDGLRYELLDGMLLVSPPAAFGHYSAAFELGVLLKAALGDEWRIACNPGVSMGSRNYREPDLVVVHPRAVAQKLADAEAGDVLLVVEAISPERHRRPVGQAGAVRARPHPALLAA